MAGPLALPPGWQPDAPVYPGVTAATDRDSAAADLWREPLTDKVELEALDLAALLCSRVCHDIISPVGAIINGLEVLDEDNSEEMRDFAFGLIRRSAAQASAKLQFARLAFGAAGSAGAEIDLGDAEKVARGYMEGEKAEFALGSAPRADAQEPGQAAPQPDPARRRRRAARRLDQGRWSTGEPTRRRSCCARPARARACRRPSRSWCRAISTALPVDAQAVQAYYTGALARACGMAVAAGLDGEDVVDRRRRSPAPSRPKPAFKQFVNRSAPSAFRRPSDRLVAAGRAAGGDAMKHCLVVDDSSVIRKVARRILEDFDFARHRGRGRRRGARRLPRARCPT